MKISVRYTVGDLLDKVGVCKDDYKLVSISCNLIMIS